MPEWTVPAPGWVTISVEGDRVTKFQVRPEDTILVELQVDETCDDRPEDLP